MIIDAAEQVFAERGYEAATTVEIAERAGVNRAVLWRHFATKEELFRKTVTLPFLDFLNSWVPKWQEQHEGETWTDDGVVRTFVIDLLENLRAHQDAVRLLFVDRRHTDPELQAGVEEAVASLLKQLNPIFEQEFKDRGYPLPYAELSGRFLLRSVIAAAVIEPQLGPPAEPTTDDELIDHLVKTILYGGKLGA